jgi:hypothetical protein
MIGLAFFAGLVLGAMLGAAIMFLALRSKP